MKIEFGKHLQTVRIDYHRNLTELGIYLQGPRVSIIFGSFHINLSFGSQIGPYQRNNRLFSMRA